MRLCANYGGFLVHVENILVSILCACHIEKNLAVLVLSNGHFCQRDEFSHLKSSIEK